MEFSTEQKPNPNPDSNFQNIHLSFDKIEGISKEAENNLEDFLSKNEDEISNLLSSVYDVNQIYFNPKYISKIVENKIKKIFNLDGFFLYFKNEPKIRKLKKGEKVKEKKKKEKVEEKKEEVNEIEEKKEEVNEIEEKKEELNEIEEKKEEVNEMQKKKEEEKKEKEKGKQKNQKKIIKEEEKEEIHKNEGKKHKKSNNESFEKEKNNEENSKKSESSMKFSVSEIKASDSSKSEIIFQDSSISQKISFDEKNNLIIERILPEFYSNNEDELFDGKDYESRVRSYLKLFFECCTEKDIKIESNPGRDITFAYNFYEKIIKKYNSKKNEIINGTSHYKSEAEFDFIIKNINKDIILSIKENFKGNIICSSDLNSLNENKNYQIIGEVAKNILHQSSDKIKQINKYVDIILINDIIKNIKNIESIENKEKIVMNFNTLNFNFNDDKIIMIVTDGSYVKLSKASDFDKQIENQSLTSREIKDIQNYRKIIQLLKKSKIPFIIFFIPNDLRNNIDDYLIEHAKKKNYNEIKTKSENDIYKCYSIKLIEEKIDKFKKNIFNTISSICSSKNKILENISNNLYDEIIEGINLKNIFNLELVILKNWDINIDDIEDYISIRSITEKKGIKYVKEVVNNEKDLNKYIENHKKVPNDTFSILFIKSNINDNIKFLYDKYDAFSFVIGGIDGEDISPQARELEKIFNDKFRNFCSQQIKKKIYKYCLYYSNNKEYLNGENLKNKIIYDLGKLNLNIKVKNNEKSFSESESYNNLLNIINNIEFVKEIQTYYKYDLSQEIKDVLGIKDEHFENLNKNKFNVFEEFYCWRLYEMFFNLLIENILY